VFRKSVNTPAPVAVGGIIQGIIAVAAVAAITTGIAGLILQSKQ
jgi:putative effector of murein hydrolase